MGLRYEFTSIPASSKLQSLNAASSVAGVLTIGPAHTAEEELCPPHRRRLCARMQTPPSGPASASTMTLSTTTSERRLRRPSSQVTETVAANTPAAATTSGFLAVGGLPTNANFATVAAARAATTAYVPNQKVPLFLNSGRWAYSMYSIRTTLRKSVMLGLVASTLTFRIRSTFRPR